MTPRPQNVYDIDSRWFVDEEKILITLAPALNDRGSDSFAGHLLPNGRLVDGRPHHGHRSFQLLLLYGLRHRGSVLADDDGGLASRS